MSAGVPDHAGEDRAEHPDGDQHGADLPGQTLDPQESPDRRRAEGPECRPALREKAWSHTSLIDSESAT